MIDHHDPYPDERCVSRLSLVAAGVTAAGLLGCATPKTNSSEFVFDGTKPFRGGIVIDGEGLGVTFLVKDDGDASAPGGAHTTGEMKLDDPRNVAEAAPAGRITGTHVKTQNGDTIDWTTDSGCTIKGAIENGTTLRAQFTFTAGLTDPLQAELQVPVR